MGTLATRRLVGALAAVALLGVSGGAASYTIRPGDTLSGIAAAHGVSTRSLAAANGIADPNRVIAGRTLTIPGSGGSAPALTPTRTYRVAPGDTLSGIAARHGVSTHALAAANGIADLNRVVAGSTLQIPGGTGASVPAAPVSRTYTVVRGDTLSAIAARHRVSVRALADANGIVDVHLVRLGSRLVIPGSDLTSPTPAGGGAPAAAIDPSAFPARLRAAPDRLALLPTFQRWASAYGTPLGLLLATAWLESGWQNGVVSSVGARGIGQLMPATVTWMRDVVIREPLDAARPDDNIRMTARYLRWLLDRTGGDEATALAGYYQGLASVRARGMYESTKVYVAGVLSLREQHFGR